MDGTDRIPPMLVCITVMHGEVSAYMDFKSTLSGGESISLCKEEIVGNHIADTRLWPSSYPLQGLKGRQGTCVLERPCHPGCF